jgi:hypothetical protein
MFSFSLRVFAYTISVLSMERLRLARFLVSRNAQFRTLRFKGGFVLHSKLAKDSYRVLSKTSIATWKVANLGTISLEEYER